MHNVKDKEVNEDVEFVLIGAGLPRTGTASTYTALERLLPGRCHHMFRAKTGSNDPAFWTQAARGELGDEDWKEFIRTERLSAAVDFPMSLYWRDLARMYPRAKVLLTVRDPVRWHQSVSTTIRQLELLMEQSWLALPLRLLGRITGNRSRAATMTTLAPTYLGPRYPGGLFGTVDLGVDTAVRFFNEWVEQVKAEIPAERLLVFEVKQGWAPLCQFLGVPVPEEPFPNVNDTAEMRGNIARIRRTCVLLWSGAALGLGAAAYCLKDIMPRPRLVFQ